MAAEWFPDGIGVMLAIVLAPIAAAAYVIAIDDADGSRPVLRRQIGAIVAAGLFVCFAVGMVL